MAAKLATLNDNSRRNRQFYRFLLKRFPFPYRVILNYDVIVVVDRHEHGVFLDRIACAMRSPDEYEDMALYIIWRFEHGQEIKERMCGY